MPTLLSVGLLMRQVCLMGRSHQRTLNGRLCPLPVMPWEVSRQSSLGTVASCQVSEQIIHVSARRVEALVALAV